MRLAVVCGLVEEANIIKSILGRSSLVYCGAEQMHNLSKLVPADVTNVISWGVCGGLAPADDLGVGDILIGSSVVTDDDAFLVDGSWFYRLSRALGGMRARSGAFYSGGTQGADTPKERTALYEKTGAWAIDDESFYAAKLARERCADLAILRTVSDDANATIPQAALSATNPDGSSNIAAILRALNADPPEWLDMPKVEIGFGMAVQRLWDVARRTKPNLQAE